MAAGFLEGFSSGLSNVMSQGGGGGQGGGMSEYQAARLGQQQQQLETSQATAQSTQALNAAKLQGVELDNEAAQKKADFEAGVMKAASVGGFTGAIDFAIKQGNYQYAHDRLQEQQDLNASIAKSNKLTAESSSAQIKAYNDKMKALGGLGAVFFKDVQSGLEPKAAYQRYLPNIKEIWPDAPNEYDEKTANYLKIAVSQQLQQNTNYSRFGAVGKALDGYNAAREAGDSPAMAYFGGQLAKQQMIMNPVTGEFINLVGDVKDNFRGSADDKANAVGLGAGSSIAPIPGAVFKAQPMNNVMSTAYSEYDKNNKVQPQERVMSNLRAKTGWETVIQPDGSVSQREIEGSPDSQKPKMQSMEASRFQLLQQGQLAYNKMLGMLYENIPGTNTLDQSNVNWKNLMTATPDSTPLIGQYLGEQGVPHTTGRQLRNLFNGALTGILYGTSGATIAESEKPFLNGVFMPNAMDDDETIKQKMHLMHELLVGTVEAIKYGINGQPLKDKDGKNILDHQKFMEIAQYIANGGEALDLTRGKGMDMEKAKANKAKQLSYDPQQVQKYMSAQNNGQGRDLTEDEAKKFIDGARAKGIQLQ